MRKMMRAAILAVAFMMIGAFAVQADAQAKTRSIKIAKGKHYYAYKSTISKAKSVSVKISKPNLVTYKIDKADGCVKLTGKALGTTSIRITVKKKNGKKSVYRYKAKVYRAKTAKEKAKEGFEILNRYRKEAGVEPLEWSDDLYEFAIYRVKTSGFDHHENLCRDQKAFFGDAYTEMIRRGYILSENLASSYSNDYPSVMQLWKESPGHYGNMISASHKCAAIASIGNTYITLFADITAEEYSHWKDLKDESVYKKITIREKNHETGEYVDSAVVSFYDVEDKWRTLDSVRIRQSSGVEVSFLIGHTYVIYDNTIGTGEGKVKRVKITVTEDCEDVIELIS